MRFTDKAKEASAALTVPKGLDPSLIGKVVEVKIFRKRDGVVLTESLEKHVGILMNYSLMSSMVQFTLEGASEYTVSHTNSVIEFSAPALIRK